MVTAWPPAWKTRRSSSGMSRRGNDACTRLVPSFHGRTRMIATMLLCIAWLPWALASSDPPQESELAAYRAANAKAERTADAHVKLALWCEAHGLDAERLKHLTLATLLDPSHAAARGLLGLVSQGDKWQRPDEASRQAAEDPARMAALREYLERRTRT